jgi:very-short-patch-repair endonuclease
MYSSVHKAAPISSTSDLVRAGASPSAIARAVKSGELIRARRGHYLPATAHPDEVEAVHIGGQLTGPSAARHYGLWTVDDDRLHVLVPRNAARLRLARSESGVSDRRGRLVCLHWGTAAPTGPRDRWDSTDGHLAAQAAVVDACCALADMTSCQQRERVVATADSALNLHVLSREAVAVAIPNVIHWCDGRSQAGTESLVRVRLRAKRVRALPQARIRCVGFVDLLVGDRLVIECDSATFHDGYTSERDYDRDLKLVSLGYLVIRLRYRHVMHEWDVVEAIILELVRSGRHLWSRGQRGHAVSL